MSADMTFVCDPYSCPQMIIFPLESETLRQLCDQRRPDWIFHYIIVVFPTISDTVIAFMIYFDSQFVPSVAQSMSEVWLSEERRRSRGMCRSELELV